MTVRAAVHRHPVLAASAAMAILTVFLTWPQAANLQTKVAGHIDPYFSMWRLGWIAHALETDPARLYDGNIYHPAPRTLAYSDAAILEGAVAAPLIWSGVSLVTAYNLLLLAGIATSGIGMFVLVRYLTGSGAAALVSAAIFTLAPYRIEHYMHLELQWAVWTPLTLWALHRAAAERSWRFGALTGLFLWFQMLSCVYYGIFLAMLLPVFTAALLLAEPKQAAARIARLALGVLIAAALTYAYARPYLENARTLGSRNAHETVLFSAQPVDYLASPRQNWVWGWTAERFGNAERRLFPGLAATMLAVLALFSPRRRFTWAYALLGLWAVELSFGVNGRAYSWLHEHLTFLQSLRASARFGIFVLFAVAVLAGFGAAALRERFAPGRRWLVTIALVLLVALESASAPMLLTEISRQTPDVYRALRGFEPGVVLELPLPRLDTMPGNDPFYEFWSTTHWKPLVNGYSGYPSREYPETIVTMARFPDNDSIARLRALNVRYILAHDALFDRKAFTDLMVGMARRKELVPRGRFRDWAGQTEIFELKP